MKKLIFFNFARNKMTFEEHNLYQLKFEALFDSEKGELKGKFSRI